MNKAISLCNCLPADGNQVREISKLVFFYLNEPSLHNIQITVANLQRVN